MFFHLTVHSETYDGKGPVNVNSFIAIRFFETTIEREFVVVSTYAGLAYTLKQKKRVHGTVAKLDENDESANRHFWKKSMWNDTDGGGIAKVGRCIVVQFEQKTVDSYFSCSTLVKVQNT